MYFQPIDEMSLRHLFSSRYGEDRLKMSYLGPVLDPSAVPQTSPDCLVLDKRGEEWRVLRCEFKYIPSGKEDFEHNGQFDIAVLWRIPPTTTREELEKELLAQNGCHEIVVLTEDKAFSELPKYHKPEPEEFNRVDKLRSIILKRQYPTVVAAFIAATIYPEEFHIDVMVDKLSSRFPQVKRMKPQGRANVVSALLMTKPPLLRYMRHKFYRWTHDINAKRAAAEIGKMIRTNFRKDIPSRDTIEEVKRASSY